MKSKHITAIISLSFIYLFFLTAFSAPVPEGEILHPKDIFILPQQKTIKVAPLLGTPHHIDPAKAEPAIRRAVSLWNQALKGRLTLVVSAMTTAPRNELFITVETSNNPAFFNSSGNELGYTTLFVVKSRKVAQVKIILNDCGASNIFSTGGALDSTYDLCLVVLHELGHALGLGHDPGSVKYPPVMAPRMGNNLQMNQWTGKPIAQLRQLYPQDASMLTQALKKNEDFDFAGTYEGTLTYTGINRDVKFKGFKIEQTKDKVTLNFAGNRVEGYGGVSLYLLKGQKLKLTGVKGWINFVKLKKNGSDLEVDLERTAGGSKKKYLATGTLKKIK